MPEARDAVAGFPSGRHVAGWFVAARAAPVPAAAGISGAGSVAEFRVLAGRVDAGEDRDGAAVEYEVAAGGAPEGRAVDSREPHGEAVAG